MNPWSCLRGSSSSAGLDEKARPNSLAMGCSTRPASGELLSGRTGCWFPAAPYSPKTKGRTAAALLDVTGRPELENQSLGYCPARTGSRRSNHSNAGMTSSYPRGSSGTYRETLVLVRCFEPRYAVQRWRRQNGLVRNGYSEQLTQRVGAGLGVPKRPAGTALGQEASGYGSLVHGATLYPQGTPVPERHIRQEARAGQTRPHLPLHRAALVRSQGTSPFKEVAPFAE